MISFDDFVKVTNDLAKEFNLSVDTIHPQVLSLKAQDKTVEVARMIYSEVDQVMGIHFEITIVNTDAILIYSAGYKLNRELRLYESFYEDGLGILHKGVDARLAVEQDREASMYQRIMEEERAQEESEYQIKQMERTGKITFH